MPLPFAGVERRRRLRRSALGRHAASRLSFISTGCSSRDTIFSPWPRSPTRSVISLFDCASLLAADGTILLGVVSALITGGGTCEPEEPNSAR